MSDENEDSQQQSNLDAERFVQLLLQHEPQVRSFLRGLLPSWQDVDDVLQESGLIAWRKFAEFEEGTAFGGWFLTIARYEALAHRRRLAKSPLVFNEELWHLLADEKDTNETSADYRRHLQDCLKKLAPEKREALLRVHVPGVLMRDVAKQTGKTEQGFYKLIQRLRISLMECVTRSMSAEQVPS